MGELPVFLPAIFVSLLFMIVECLIERIVSSYLRCIVASADTRHLDFYLSIRKVYIFKLLCRDFSIERAGLLEYINHRNAKFIAFHLIKERHDMNTILMSKGNMF